MSVNSKTSSFQIILDVEKAHLFIEGDLRLGATYETRQHPSIL